MFVDGKEYDVKVPRTTWNKGKSGYKQSTYTGTAKANHQAAIESQRGKPRRNSPYYKGKPYMEWAKELGVDRSTIRKHILQYGNLDKVNSNYFRKDKKILDTDNIIV